MTARRGGKGPRDLPARILRHTRPAVGRRNTPAARGGSDGSERGLMQRLRPGRKCAIAGVVLGIFGVLGGGAYAAYASPIFEVSTVEVRGNENVEAATIAGRADLAGESMFTADLSGAQHDIYEIARLETVRLERSWPDTVVIHVEERQPWGTWEQGGLSYTIDRDGVVLGTADDIAPPEDPPVIVSSEVGARDLGERVDHHAVAVARDIYELLPERLGTSVTEVAFLTGKGVQVTTADGHVAVLGDSSGMDYKLAVWAEMAATAEEEDIDYNVIDLRYGNRPVLQ